MFYRSNNPTNLFLLLGLAFVGFVVFSDVVEEKNKKTEAAAVVKNVITVNCKDGTCYDPKTGKEIGNDPEVPVHLTMPVKSSN